MIVAAGSTNVTTYFKLVNPATGVPETALTIADLDATYVRDGAAAQKADLSTPGGYTVTSAHTDNAAIVVDATNAPGLYRVDWPDAAFAAGVSRVQLVVNGAAIDPAVIEVELGVPWNTAWDAEAQSEVDDALTAFGFATDADVADAVLDEAAAGHTGVIAVNLDAAVSTRSTLTAAQVWANATRTLTSFGTLVADAAAAVWAYVTRTLTSSAASTAATVAGSTVTVTRGDTATIALTGLGDLSLRTKLWFTVKDKDWHTDAQSVLQIEETGGLLYLNGATTTTGNATLVVDDESAGNITITLKAAATAALTPGAYKYDIQQLTTTPAVLTETTGSFVVAADYTRAVS